MKCKSILLLSIACSSSIWIAGCGKPEDSGSGKSLEAPIKADSTAPSQHIEVPTAKTAASPAGGVTATTQMLSNIVVKPAMPVTPPMAQPDAPPKQPVTTTENQIKPTLATLSQNQIVQGLQEALAKGLQQAVARLGQEGGFLNNATVKIPMPEKLQKVESTLRALKQDKLADDFITTMNRAAEQAIPAAASVFADALKQLSIEDAKSILTGPTNAATQYFQGKTRTNLYSRFYPIVQKATEKTGVTSAYKAVVDKASAGQSLGNLGKLVGGSQLDKSSLDLDAYVTDKTLDGLFKMIAQEEAQIRQNPVARTTDMLQKVFGALK